MRSVKLDRRDPLDLHEQVAGEIRRAIADGEAKPGERLPPAKDLAAILGVNTNTVLRALRQLRDEGLLEFAAAAASRSPAPPNRALSSNAPKSSSTSRASRATDETNSSRSSKRSPSFPHPLGCDCGTRDARVGQSPHA